MKNCSPNHFSLHGSRANFNRLAFIFVAELEGRLRDNRLFFFLAPGVRPYGPLILGVAGSAPRKFSTDYQGKSR